MPLPLWFQQQEFVVAAATLVVFLSSSPAPPPPPVSQNRMTSEHVARLLIFAVACADSRYCFDEGSHGTDCVFRPAARVRGLRMAGSKQAGQQGFPLS